MDKRIDPSSHQLLRPSLALHVVVLGALIGVSAALGGAERADSAGWITLAFIGVALIGVIAIIATARIGEHARRIALTCISGSLITLCLWSELGGTATRLPGLSGALIGIGIGLLALERRHRVGAALHCARCDYPHADGPQCPECGKMWNEPHALRLGTRKRRPWMMWLGIALIATALVSIPVALLRGKVWSLAPTSIIISAAVAPGADQAVFRELDSRSLTPRDRARIIDALIAERESGAAWSMPQQLWMDRAVRANIFSPTQMDRYCRAILTLALHAHGEARVGQSVRIEVVRADPPLAIGNDWLHVWIAGSWTGREPTLVRIDDAWTQWDSPVRFDARLLSTLPTSGPTLLPGVDVTPSAAGPMRVSVVLWLAAGPSRPPLVLNPDDTPRFAGPLAPVWNRRIELQTTLDVRP